MANWKKNVKIAGIACAIVAGLIFVPIIIMNTDGNPWNDIRTFDDWIDSYTGPDLDNDTLARQLPDQHDAVGYVDNMRYPFLPQSYYILTTPTISAGLCFNWNPGVFAILISITNVTRLVSQMGLERERDLYCNNGTAHVFWFNSLPHGRPLVADNTLHPGFFYVINVGGTWFVNQVAAAYTLHELTTVMANNTGANYIYHAG